MDQSNLIQNLTSSEQLLPVQCQKCRFLLCSYADVVNSHGETVNSKSCSNDVWYIPEEKFPQWIKENIHSGKWIKGKMNCPKCSARLGSYNFISGMKCNCGDHVLPPVHIVKSKVDVITQSHHISNLISSSITSN